VKFSIRDLLLVTVIVALAVVAGLSQLDRQRLAKENTTLREELKTKPDRFGGFPPVTTPPKEPGLPPSSFGP
jgi:hypothetical protein